MADSKMATQTAEFDTAVGFSKRLQALMRTPVVDGDYPEMRHYYEAALQDFIAALRANGRLDPPTPAVNKVESEAAHGVALEWDTLTTKFREPYDRDNNKHELGRNVEKDINAMTNYQFLERLSSALSELLESRP